MYGCICGGVSEQVRCGWCALKFRCMYIHVHVRENVLFTMYTYTCTCTCTFTCTCVYACTNTHAHTHTHTHAHTHTHTHTLTHTHTHTHTHSLMFWSDWGEDRPQILRAGLDGTSKEVLVRANIDTPNGLALDYEGKRVYWADGVLDTIEMIHYDGRWAEFRIPCT